MEAFERIQLAIRMSTVSGETEQNYIMLGMRRGLMTSVVTILMYCVQVLAELHMTITMERSYTEKFYGTRNFVIVLQRAQHYPKRFASAHFDCLGLSSPIMGLGLLIFEVP